jgi:photosynthetic reaction center cytochrome c subunit
VNLLLRGGGTLAGLLLFAATIAAYKKPEAVQIGNPGLAMEVLDTPENLARKVKANAVPAPLPAASKDGQLAVDAYTNVQVLGNLSSGEFTRLMTAMTLWVAPDNGCAYCHAPQRDAKGQIVKDEDGSPQADLNNLGSDELYAKRVARRMLQMTMHINGYWKKLVKTTGVTCYTCHRGKPVPTYLWFDEPDSDHPESAMGNRAGQNAPSELVGLTSLPSSSLRPFLGGEDEIRVQSTVAIDSPNRSSIKQTEWTYSLMVHFSNSLGVNCTYCHNTRSMGVWDTSPLTRTTAWYGIRMVRNLNQEFLEPLAPTFPAERKGPLGDGPKLSCATCHQGAYKPLLGVSMLGDYAELSEARPQPQKKAALAPAAAVDAAGGPGDAGPAAAPADAGAAPAAPASSGGAASTPSAASASAAANAAPTKAPATSASAQPPSTGPHSSPSPSAAPSASAKP